MANIRVKCPACKSELEIDESYEGQEVECGNCLEVFAAKRVESAGTSASETPSGRGSGGGSSRGKRSSDDDDDDRPRRKRRRRPDDEEYDDSEDYYSPPRRRSGGSNGLAIASLILGITSIFPGCCCALLGIPLSLGAIITGSIAMKNPDGKGMAVAGLVLGVCGLVLMIVLIILNAGMNMNNPGRFR